MSLMLKSKEVLTMSSKKVKGIPSLGGKTRLAETIRDIIYEQVEAGNVSNCGHIDIDAAFKEGDDCGYAGF